MESLSVYQVTKH